MECLLAVIYRPLQTRCFMGKGNIGFEDPHSEAKMRAASLAPGYLRISYLIIKLWEACKD